MAIPKVKVLQLALRLVELKTQKRKLEMSDLGHIWMMVWKALSEQQSGTIDHDGRELLKHWHLTGQWFIIPDPPYVNTVLAIPESLAYIYRLERYTTKQDMQTAWANEQRTRKVFNSERDKWRR
jgi:hypothetical protein